jgi:hypothetical protein
MVVSRSISLLTMALQAFEWIAWPFRLQRTHRFRLLTTTEMMEEWVDRMAILSDMSGCYYSQGMYSSNTQTAITRI